MVSSSTNRASYNVELVNNTMVIIIASASSQDGSSVIREPGDVVARVHAGVANLSVRQLIYRDQTGQFYELSHKGGEFRRVSPCSDSLRLHLESLVQ